MFSTEPSVATTIAAQIGQRAFFMMGTQHKYGVGQGLTFNVRGSKKCTHVNVMLNAEDTYDVSFRKVRARTVKEVAKVEGVYVGMLHEVIAEHTGLALSL